MSFGTVKKDHVVLIKTNGILWIHMLSKISVNQYHYVKVQ